MKAKTCLWIINVLLFLVFSIFTFVNINYCNINGFLIFSETNYFPSLLFICEHPSVLSWCIAGTILIICLLIIYLNNKEVD